MKETLAVLFRRALDQQQNEHRNSSRAEAYRVDSHDALKRVELSEHGVYPHESYSADAYHSYDRRRQGYSVASQISADDIVEQ